MLVSSGVPLKKRPVGSGAKKIGGVKRERRGKTPAASVHETPKKKIGGVKLSPRGSATGSGHMQSCIENCSGEYVMGTWIHSRECVWAPVLWKAHGKTLKDWHCLYDCEPLEMSSCWTHPYTCPFWDRTGATPFDQPAPAESRREKTSAPTQTVNTKSILPKAFHELPIPLQELENEDDGLPF